MTKLILIRHGLTDYNLEKRYCGFRNIDLNKMGRAQAKKIKTKLKGLKIDRVFCSDLKRNLNTAKIIFHDRSCAIIKRPNLREINFGKWEGLNFKQILNKFSCIYRKWVRNPCSVNIPGGEKTSHFIMRIRKELKGIVKNNADKTIAIVSHFGPMRIILNDARGIDKIDNFWQMQLEPEAIYIIEYKKYLKPKVYKL